MFGGTLNFFSPSSGLIWGRCVDSRGHPRYSLPVLLDGYYGIHPGDIFLCVPSSSLQFPDRSWECWGFASSVNTTAKIEQYVFTDVLQNLFYSLLHDSEYP